MSLIFPGLPLYFGPVSACQESIHPSHPRPDPSYGAVKATSIHESLRSYTSNIRAVPRHDAAGEDAAAPQNFAFLTFYRIEPIRIRIYLTHVIT